MSIMMKNLVATITPPSVIDDSLKIIKVGGSKHCFLYLFVIALFFDNKTIIFDNVPKISETDFLVDYAISAGAIVYYEKNKNRITIEKGVKYNFIPTNFVINCRSSLLVTTLHILKFGYVKVYANFGGCDLGDRKIDQHIKLWKMLGCQVSIEKDLLEVKTLKDIMHSEFIFDIATTTGSVAAIYALVAKKLLRIKGITVRPEIFELINFVNLCGYEVFLKEDTLIYVGEHTNIIKVKFKIPSDIDETIGYSCICHSMGINADIVTSIPRIAAMQFLEQHSNNEITWNDDKIQIRANNNKSMSKICRINANGYPDIGSDQQPILAVWASTIYESVEITETKFKTRFNYLKELSKLGWKSEIYNGRAITQFVKSNDYQEKMELVATDLRAGFAEILAIVITKKQANIRSFEQILRGYSNVEKTLKSLNLDLKVSQYKNNDSVAILLTYYDKIIMQKRDYNALKSPNTLSFWGGAIEENEKPYVAAKRELFEELGIVCPLKYIGKFSINKRFFSNTGEVYLYRADIKELSVLNCNEGRICVSTINECLNERLSTFARVILEQTGGKIM